MITGWVSYFHLLSSRKRDLPQKLVHVLYCPTKISLICLTLWWFVYLDLKLLQELAISDLAKKNGHHYGLKIDWVNSSRWPFSQGSTFLFLFFLEHSIHYQKFTPQRKPFYEKKSMQYTFISSVTCTQNWELLDVLSMTSKWNAGKERTTW